MYRDWAHLDRTNDIWPRGQHESLMVGPGRTCDPVQTTWSHAIEGHCVVVKPLKTGLDGLAFACRYGLVLEGRRERSLVDFQACCNHPSPGNAYVESLPFSKNGGSGGREHVLQVPEAC